MSKLELYYPAKPYTITQAFGIFNPAYEQFGFNKHNGIDFSVDTDGIVRAMCDGTVYETGFNSGAGNFVRYITDTQVDINGHLTYAGFMYMHADHVLVTKGQKIKAGDALIVADNTGFSTGPHTHISAYPCNEQGQKLALFDKDSDYCFDFSKFYNGLYSDDIGQVQVDPATEKIVSDTLASVKTAAKFPALRAASLKVLQSLSDFLSKYKKTP